MAYFEQFKQIDAQTLYSGSISSATVGSAIDTTNFGNIVVQFSSTAGVGLVQAYIEGSNDQAEWFPILLNNLNDLSITDTVTAEGGYQFKTTYQYIRTNVTYVTGTYNITVLGRAGSGASAADNLAAAFNQDTPINVALQGVKKDASGAIFLADGVCYPLVGTNSFTFDCTGYGTIVVYNPGGVVEFLTQSFDGEYFFSTNFPYAVNSVVVSNGNGGGIQFGPVYGRYFRVVLSGSYAAGSTCPWVMLKQGTFNASIMNNMVQSFNLAQINGTGINVGTNGVLSVAGANAVGTTIVNNPVPVGGTDSANLVRRTQTDMAGRTMVTGAIPTFQSFNSNSPQANTALPINAVGAIPATFQQTAALNVQDSTQFEGQTQTELLAQILLELRILNQQMYELPRLLNTNQQSQDPPETFRAEPSIFNQ